MAVVEFFAPEVYGVLDAEGILRGDPDYTQVRGAMHVKQGTVTNLASDNSGSKYRIGRFPSSCILHHDATIDLQSWGFVIAKIGIETDTDAILSVADTTLLAAVSTPITLFGAKWNKPLWEACGLSADPGGEIELSVFTEADAAGAGSAPFSFPYLYV